MPRYEVLEAGFFDGVYRKPGCPRHGHVITDAPLKPVPEWLKEIKEETEAQRNARDAAAQKLQNKVKGNKKEIAGASFMDNDKSTGGVEVL